MASRNDEPNDSESFASDQGVNEEYQRGSSESSEIGSEIDAESGSASE
jgi:hypothetical protein